jgi:Rad3-related DNA helicase
MIAPKSYPFVLAGVDVDFPHENPYPGQMALISSSIRAFLHFDNALLESPTGTGKSLALLAGALSYQKHIGTHPILPPVKRDPYLPHPEEMDPNYGQPPAATFIPASQLMRAPVSPDAPDDPYKCNVVVKRHNVPVWYTSRTHSQLKQLIGELKKLPYFPQMTMLAARKRICLYDPVKLSGDPDNGCLKALAKNKCPYSRNRGIPDEFRPRGRFGKSDLEALVEYCRSRMMCPYFWSREI